MDDEVKGDGNSVAFTYRVHDPRLGRFLSIDPLTGEFPWNSPYAFSENRVTNAIEFEGLESVDLTGSTYNYTYLNAENRGENGFEAVKQQTKLDLTMQLTGLKLGIYGLLMAYAPNIGFPLAVSEITGLPAIPSPQAYATTMSSAANAIDDAAAAAPPAPPSSKITQFQANKAQGAIWEAQVGEELQTTNTAVKPQITVQTQSGVRTRVDFVSTTKEGQITLTEAKSSSTAPLTRNQALAFPEIEISGATVVGKGKAPYTRGTIIPPTKVEIMRPAEGLQVAPPIIPTFLRPSN